MERMSRMCTPSSSSSWRIFLQGGYSDHFGDHVFDELGGQLGDVLDELLGFDPTQQASCVHLHQV